MYFNNLKLDIIAPTFIQQEWTEAEVLGSTVWLWMNSDSHNELPLHTLSVALLPAIKTKPKSKNRTTHNQKPHQTSKKVTTFNLCNS
jgi:hemolysin-activating ACP:hemolysin acyltransferase